MNVSLWINLAVACVSPPIGTSQADPFRTLNRNGNRSLSRRLAIRAQRQRDAQSQRIFRSAWRSAKGASSAPALVTAGRISRSVAAFRPVDEPCSAGS
jgi:hypothetical protein